MEIEATMNDGTFGYKDLREPDDKEKLEAHVILHPHDLIACNLLNAITRIESLEYKSVTYDQVSHLHKPLG